jgi:hypothetical protein
MRMRDGAARRRNRLGVLAGALLLVGVSAAQVQAQNPPNAWHPYRGATNCIQVADRNGNFSCSPLVTIDPATGAFQALGGTGAFSPVFGALVIAPSGNTLQALGNDLVIAKSAGTIAPAGPGKGAVTIRLRPSPVIPGWCRLVVVAGTGFAEFPLAVITPASSLDVALGFNIYDAVSPDFPGGPAGC